MLFRALAPSFVAALLAAQETAPPKVAKDAKKAEAEANAAAAAPLKFAKTPPPVNVETVTRDAIAALLRLPEGDDHDQWPYEGVYREDDGQLPVGYRVGGTSIVCLSLIAAPGYREDAARQAAVERGVAFVLKTLEVPRMQNSNVGNYDVRGWGHIYGLTLFLELLDQKLAPTAHAAAVAEKTKWLVKVLCESAIPGSGGWNYARARDGWLSPNSHASTFMTPPALQALFHAKARGYEVDDKVLDQALAALERARSEPGGYAYGAPAESQNAVPAGKLAFMDQVPSSAARATACEATLLLAGRGDQERLHRAVLRFFANWDYLAERKSQQGTHVQPYGIAPYYFLYGHLYAAQAIELLDDSRYGSEKEELRTQMRAFLARSREADGSWNDRQFPRSAGFGTALAILCLWMPKLSKPEPRPLPAKKG
jgi:hypothetical protein